MSITTALKKLAKNVFNVDTTGNNIDEILDDIANNASGGSGGGSTTGGVLVVNFIAYNDGEHLRLDKTWSEIENVVSNGGMVFAKVAEGSDFNLYYVQRVDCLTSEELPYIVYFRKAGRDGGEEFGTATANGYPSTEGGSPK